MARPEITKAAATELDRCISAQVIAFAADPLLRWVLPDSATFLRYFPQVLVHYGGRAFEHGTAWRTADFAASAMWLPPGVEPDGEALGALVSEAVDPERVPHVFGLLEQVAQAHPAEPHWFLPAIGVDPAWQGRGYGSALLERSLEACDRDHKVAYLEASNPRNVPLYERFGFEVTGEFQVGTSPVVYPMVRPAR